MSNVQCSMSNRWIVPWALSIEQWILDIGEEVEVIKQHIVQHVRRALEEMGDLTQEPEIVLERPKDEQHGDLSTNVAMMLSKTLRRPPRQIAEEIAARFEVDGDLIAAAEVAGPGFVNFRLGTGWLYRSLREIVREGDGYGRSGLGKGKRANVEFVSANPTGPLTVAHGRGAAIGDTVANVLEHSGYDVTREYYFNDAGNQMRVLARSVEARYRELLGEETAFPEEGYQGDYIFDIARQVIEQHDRGLLEGEHLGLFKESAEQTIFRGIEDTLERLGIRFDVFFNEHSLYESGAIRDTIDRFRAKGLAYDRDGAVWFRATAFGIDKDRVIAKSTGEPTYRLPDMAYHVDKIERGFDLIIDVLGADHHATFQDVLTGVEVLGYPVEMIEALIHQFVTIKRGDKKVRMSTRKANFVTLDEVMEEVGGDAVRYFFVMRRINSHLDFDLELAKKQSDENPVYYVQYAHARISSILRFAEEEGRSTEEDDVDLALLRAPEEFALIKCLLEFPDLVEGVARSFEVHRIPGYLQRLASTFHYFYHEHRVVTEDLALTAARLALMRATQIVLNNGLRLVNVSAPERM